MIEIYNQSFCGSKFNFDHRENVMSVIVLDVSIVIASIDYDCLPSVPLNYSNLSNCHYYLFMYIFTKSTIVLSFLPILFHQSNIVILLIVNIVF